MLPRAHRLTSGEAFRRTIRAGRRAGAATVVLHLLPTPEGDRRVGFVVNRTVGGAVARNAVRRRLRHLVATRLGSIPTGELVVRALPAAATADSQTLGADLDRCLRRLAERSAA